MYAKILSNIESDTISEIKNSASKYIRKNEKIFESVEVIKEIKDKKTNQVIDTIKLYDEVVEIGYKLPKDIVIEEM